MTESAFHDTPPLEEARERPSVQPDGPAPQPTSAGRSEDSELDTLEDVLKRLKPARPAFAAALIALASPLVLIAKVALDSLVGDHLVLDAVSLGFLALGFTGCAVAIQDHRRAVGRAENDPHYERALAYLEHLRTAPPSPTRPGT